MIRQVGRGVQFQARGARKMWHPREGFSSSQTSSRDNGINPVGPADLVVRRNCTGAALRPSRAVEGFQGGVELRFDPCTLRQVTRGPDRGLGALVQRYRGRFVPGHLPPADFVSSLDVLRWGLRACVHRVGVETLDPGRRSASSPQCRHPFDWLLNASQSCYLVTRICNWPACFQVISGSDDPSLTSLFLVLPLAANPHRERQVLLVVSEDLRRCLLGSE